MPKIEKFDHLLKDAGPAAIVFHRKLKPVEGKDSWIFPPTFAQSESAAESEEGGGGDYQIDPLPDDDRRNVCLIDSVGSQANRIEPIFKQERYSALVPQLKITLKGDDEINLLDAGHRAADAVVRFSKKYGPDLSEAFKAYRDKRDCTELLRLAPTSLIFGVWDSRGTGAKIQRTLRSVIRAYNVTRAERSATYRSAYDFVGNGLIDPKHDTGTGPRNPLSEQGFKYSLATKTHGGVMVKGDIQQEAVINLVALRTLSNDLKVKRYLLGLSLVALSYRDQQGFNLREGCLLCAASKEDFRGTWKVVNFDSTEDTESLQNLEHETALEFAKETAKDMKIEKLPQDEFDQETAGKWLALKKERRKVLAKTKHPTQAIKDEESAAAEAKRKAKEPSPVTGDQPKTQ